MPNAFQSKNGLLCESGAGNIYDLVKYITSENCLANGYRLGPACSSTHVPGYINHPNLKDAGQVFVVAVNDPFVYVQRERIGLGIFC